MGKVVSVVNQKGGVGKTTTAVNLAAGLGRQGRRTLLVDVDPQGNSTSGLGVNKRELKKSSYDLLADKAAAAEVLLHTAFDCVDLIPSSMDLAGAEIEMVDFAHREAVLKTALSAVHDDYDYMIVDCPPSLGLITLNALAASDTLLVPIQCEYYALEGLAQLMSTVRLAKQRYNPTLELEGVLLTMYDGRLNLTQQVVSEVKRFFPRKVFATVIPRSVRLSEAPSFGRPIQYYDAHSKGAKAYDALAREIVEADRL